MGSSFKRQDEIYEIAIKILLKFGLKETKESTQGSLEYDALVCRYRQRYIKGLQLKRCVASIFR